MTTWGTHEAPAIQQLLSMPEHWAVAAIVPLGKPKKPLTRLRRKPVAQILTTNSWNLAD